MKGGRRVRPAVGMGKRVEERRELRRRRRRRRRMTKTTTAVPAAGTVGLRESNERPDVDGLVGAYPDAR